MKPKWKKSKIEKVCKYDYTNEYKVEEYKMKYHNITHDDMLNGEGLRVVLWVSGCEHMCDMCHNKITWDINSGIEFDEMAKNELFDVLRQDYIAGVTLSGGDPLHISNRDDVQALIKDIRTKLPQKSIWIYTGYEWEQIKNIQCIEHIDVLIDGKYIDELNDETIMWRGSSNQKIIDVQKSIEQNKIVLY